MALFYQSEQVLLPLIAVNLALRKSSLFKVRNLFYKSVLNECSHFFHCNISLFPIIWSQEGDRARGFPWKFCIPGLGFQDAPKVRTAPGSASKDPTKFPFLWHQSKEFQPGFLMFLLLFNKTRVKPNLYSKIFSWQQERIRVQQPC